MQDLTAILALDTGDCLGESPIWDAARGCLHWVDIHEAEIWSWQPGQSPTVRRMPARVGAIGLAQDGLILALERGFAVLDHGSEQPRAFHALPLPAHVRLNDGRMAPDGRFICGAMEETAPQQGLARLYAWDGTRAEVLREGIRCTNALAFGPQGQMYFTDMPSSRIEVFDGAWRVFADLSGEAGLPDGACVDAEGCLWVAMWGGGGLLRLSPGGEIIARIPLAVLNPTCPCFGGPDLATLYVTSARFGLPAGRAPAQDGALLALRPGVRGRPEHLWGGR